MSAILDEEFTGKGPSSKNASLKPLHKEALEPGEKLIWEGRPFLQALIDDPSMDRGRDNRFLYSLIILAIPAIIGFGVFWMTGKVLTAIFLSGLLLCLMLAFLPPHFFFNRFLKYNKTEYRVTSKQLIFLVDRGDIKSRKTLSWNEVRQLRYSPYADHLGTIHFMTKSETEVTTYDFIGKEVRQFPTFELVENGEDVFRELERFFSSRQQ